ncbi:hypothetical protein CP532_0665, partial [Ophiocordyceps camponoti-leonardi (nom. inval.)]
MSGLQILSSARQQERSAAANGLARTPSSTPSHLSRVLYIPPHDGFFSALPVHDVSDEYEHAIRYAPLGGGDFIGPALMGSRLFVTRLATMRKPCRSDGVEYVVHARVGVSGDASLSVRSIVSISYPVPDTVSSAGTARHPYFALGNGSLPSSPTLQWQILPIEDGPLRYTLVELTTPVNIRAIYHHLGPGSSLSMPVSEGVLLVSPRGDDESEKEWRGME